MSSARAEVHAFTLQDKGMDLLKPMWYLVLGTFWVVVTVLRTLLPASSQSNMDGIALPLMVMACITVAAMGAMQVRALADGARVLGERQVPTVFWQQWQIACLKEVSVLWAITLFGVVTLMLPAHGAVSWATAGALVTVSLSLGAIASLTACRLLPAAWSWGIAVAASLALAFIGLVTGFASALRWVNDLPWIFPLLLIATWPVLAASMLRRWAKAPPRVLADHGISVFTLWRGISNQVRRYTPLQAIQFESTASNDRKALTFWNMIFLPAYLSNMVALQMGSAVGPWQVTVLGVLVVMSFSSLVCKDLHWRMLLAPGGLHPGRIGLHILLSTAAVLCMGTLAIALVLGVCAWGLFGVQFDSMLRYAARLQLLPLHLLFSVCVSTLIGGFKYPNRWMIGIFLGFIVAGLGVLWGSIQGSLVVDKAGWFTVGPEYVATLLALSATAIVLSNRLWTAEKLMRLAARSGR